ncbi:MAG: hypothetical protein SVW77_02360 [Candidatus Nanohaloarchaea archaeon]|nr:hypothetical protein [Candidatus Nanohaloarchaea archaeon]
MSQNSNGQSSLEFVTMVILVLLVFTAFVSLFSGRQVDTLQQERQRIATNVADSVAFELDLALVEGEGFSRTFELRQSIGGEDYNVSVNGTTILLTYGEDRSVVSSTAADNVTGDIVPGENRVENLGGVINVSQP